jgi:hypothetical protein
MALIDLNELIDRVVAIEQEILPGAGAYTSALVSASDFPYFLNSVDDAAVADDSESFDRLDPLNVKIFLVAGHLTADYTAQTEANLRSWIPAIIEGFNHRDRLQSNAFPGALEHLFSARIASVQGLVVSEASGVGTSQVGAVFTLACIFEYPIW